MNWSQVCGKSGVCHVKIRTYEKRDGGGTGQANQIDKLYPSYDQPQTAQNAPQQPCTAPQSSCIRRTMHSRGSSPRTPLRAAGTGDSFEE